jgi:serine/threonine-protein kinase
MGSFVNPRLSPDGQRLAMSTLVKPDIWILELARGTMTRFTLGEGLNVAPIWSPDGRRIFFTSNRNQAEFGVFSKPADGSGDAEQLTSGAYRVPSSVSSDGKTAIFRQRADNSSWDIGMIRLDGNREIEMLLQSAFDEHTGKLSPDDCWLAYVSNESGREEIYVQSFPGPGRSWQVSSEGGAEPLWARNGKELFYRNGNKMMAVAIHSEPEFSPGRPFLLFEGDYVVGRPTPYSEYSVTSDGQRFVMIKETGESSTPREITVVLNWNEELKRLAPIN